MKGLSLRNTENGFQGHILVADHDAMVRDLLEMSLSRLHHDVRMVESGREVLDLIRGEYFDLAIIEMSLPDITALDILKRLKATGTTLPHVLILGSNTTPDIIRECVEAGARDFVVKPFQVSVLIQRISMILRNQKRNRKNK